jgi:hypothetical protein
VAQPANWQLLLNHRSFKLNAIPLSLAPEEINFIQQVLGELPSKSGAFLLMQKIKQQSDAAAITQAPVTPIPQVQL